MSTEAFGFQSGGALKLETGLLPNSGCWDAQPRKGRVGGWRRDAIALHARDVCWVLG